MNAYLVGMIGSLIALCIALFWKTGRRIYHADATVYRKQFALADGLYELFEESTGRTICYEQHTNCYYVLIRDGTWTRLNDPEQLKEIRPHFGTKKQLNVFIK